MIPRLPETLLGSASVDTLVPFHPSHWSYLRARATDGDARAILDDALAVALEMSALVGTVLVDRRPECLVGLHLLPDGGSPWVMTVAPAVDRLARAVVVSQTFVAACLARCRFLQTEMEHFDGASFLWFAGLGFRNTGKGALARWEMGASDVQG